MVKLNEKGKIKTINEMKDRVKEINKLKFCCRFFCMKNLFCVRFFFKDKWDAFLNNGNETQITTKESFPPNQTDGNFL